MIRVFFFVVFTLTLLVSNGAHADNELRGARTFTFLVEPLDQDAATCGITSDDVLSATKYPIATSQIRLSEAMNLTLPMLLINVTVLPIQQTGACAVMIALSATAIAQAKLPWENAASFHTVELWRKHSVGLASKTRARDFVKSQIDDLAKRFVIDWAAQNK